MNTFLRATVLIVFAMTMSLQAHADPGSTDLPWEVFRETNLARTDPHGYANVLREFRKSYNGTTFRTGSSRTVVRTNEGVAAVDEAIGFLLAQKPLPPLSWSEALSRAAAELVEDEGATGATGHDGQKSGGMQTRIERHGEWRGGIAENISYGPATARLIVMELIVDDGVPDRGHRKNFFHRAFTTTGVSCGPHSRFNTMCVIDFAVGFSD